MPLIIPSNSISAGGYVVDNSLRFDYGSADYLNKTLGTATNRKKFTSSFWIKRTELYVNNSRQQNIFTAGTNSGTNVDQIYFRYDTLDILGYESSSTKFQFRTTQLFRDTSAWGNIVFAFDSTQSTASDRVKIYYNGSQITDFSIETYPTQNLEPLWNLNTPHYYGKNTNSANYGAYYLAECCFIDGQQLDPTSFGEFDSDSNIWKPIDVSGLTFGTNGFYLDFEDSAALGDDVSGNGNDFTVNNLTAIDQTTDTPTNNFATLNPLLDVNATPTFTEGNLVFQGTGSTNFAGATIPVSSGKWYVEVKATTVNGSYPIIGVIDAQSTLRRNSTYFVAADVDTNNPSGFAVFSNGSIYHNNSSSYGALGTTYTSGDIIGLALDMDSGTKTLGFYKNGSLQTTINLDEPPSGAYMFASGVHSSASSGKGEFNFGNPTFTISSGNTDGNGYGNFEYAVPSGYLSLCTKNLSEVLG